MQTPADEKPRLRGVFHEWAFFLSLPLGAALVLATDTTRGRVAASVFATSVIAMFGMSASYHRPNWRPAIRSWMQRFDHAGIYCLIAGSYTPLGLLTLHGTWSIVVLAIVWSGASVAIALTFAWPTAPKWIIVAIAISLGWIAVVAMPQIVSKDGLACALLILAGGIAYSVGAAIYATRRPDPVPAVFGYHELFHVLVIAAVALQYGAIAFFVLPT
jgi:hemolysin III